MKKLICFITALMLIFLSSCGAKKTVNDPDSGEITPDALEYTYHDGEYIVYTDYYDNSGYAAALKLTGDWGPLAGAEYEFIAPGSLDAANTMERRHAVGRQKRVLTTDGDTVELELPALSAGVVTVRLP